MQRNSNILLQKRDQRGFTLIELLVVVALVGVLMAVGVSSYMQYLNSGADAAEKAMAADFLTLAMADVTQNTPAGGSKQFDNANLPPGFSYDNTVADADQDIVISGVINLTTSGTIGATETLTFQASKGDNSEDSQIQAGTGNIPIIAIVDNSGS